MKHDNQKHRIAKSIKLQFKRETIKTLASRELDAVVGGFEATVEDTTCSSSIPICPTI